MRRWFYSGEKMQDGTDITIAAQNDIEAERFVEKGLKPVDARKSSPRRRPKKVEHSDG